MAALDEMRRLFGEVEGEPQVDPDQRSAANFVAHIRGLLAEATHDEKLSVSNLANLLGISKAAVSRHLRSDGDIRASTMSHFAKALNRRWELNLVPANMPPHHGPNFFQRSEAPSTSSGGLVEPPITMGDPAPNPRSPDARRRNAPVLATTA
jgi:DNA-binding transcriptional ArsR family regulator